ncbi:hypothetical protein AO375_1637 [Moraxella catarrhalis]|nr:hypothetical protein AO375_1637 [Moraxella catarrhalis]
MLGVSTGLGIWRDRALAAKMSVQSPMACLISFVMQALSSNMPAPAALA